TGRGSLATPPLLTGGRTTSLKGTLPRPAPPSWLATGLNRLPRRRWPAPQPAGRESLCATAGNPGPTRRRRRPCAAAPGPPTKDVTPPGTAPAAKAPLKTASPPTPTGGSCSSRFRVVKLDHGLGEPYRRGRWTCVDLYDWDLDSHVLAKVLDGARPVNSLDSHLELSSFTHKAVSQLRPKLHAPKSQGSPLVPYQMDNPRGKAPALAASSTLNMLIQAARTLSLDGQAATSHQPGMPAPASPPRGSPHLPAGRANVTGTPKEAGASKSTDGSVRAPTPREEAKAQLPGSKAVVGEPAASSNVKQPSGEQGAVRKYSEPRSMSVSPGPLSQDGSSPSRKTRASEPNTAAASLRFVSPMQTLAKSMLSVGTQQDSDDDR
ncbi:TSC22 domain family protein 4, partial [Scyliorhinus canicula]|uniref:TSC22 domain family protein 4 n=1 Tax=Scyliorhinus canicula TaxID=7830 RepID=UPI0018F6FD5B